MGHPRRAARARRFVVRPRPARRQFLRAAQSERATDEKSPRITAAVDRSPLSEGLSLSWWETLEIYWHEVVGWLVLLNIAVTIVTIAFALMLGFLFLRPGGLLGELERARAQR